jgi:hypothetical protein
MYDQRLFALTLCDNLWANVDFGLARSKACNSRSASSSSPACA